VEPAVATLRLAAALADAKPAFIVPELAPVAKTDSIVIVAPFEPSPPRPSLTAMMLRLETGLMRKSLAMAGADANVTALKREIRPIAGSLRAAADELHERAVALR
jgi:hypothetical protein